MAKSELVNVLGDVAHGGFLPALVIEVVRAVASIVLKDGLAIISNDCVAPFHRELSQILAVHVADFPALGVIWNPAEVDHICRRLVSRSE